MLSLIGLKIPEIGNLFHIHKTIQLEGFLTVLVMGVSYMIIPRFRNALVPSKKLVIASFLLVIASVALESAQQIYRDDNLAYSNMIRLSGILIFAASSFYTMRTVPKLLKEADYFLLISISMLIVVHIIPFFGLKQAGSLNWIQLWFLFPIMTIFGVEYKTLPSFLGFIRPKKILTAMCLACAIVACTLGVISTFYQNMELSIAFDSFVLFSIVSFALSVYIYGGFNNTELIKLMPGEKKARYDTIIRHTRIGTSFLIAGFLMGILFYTNNSFLFYDLAIHFVAIGFIGVTIMLFLPLMLPPITGKSIQFLNFNKIPLVLILSALALRTIGDYVIAKSIQSQLTMFFGISGVIVLAGMILFVRMIHKSMQETSSINVEFKKK
jgi:hypothetical protein